MSDHPKAFHIGYVVLTYGPRHTTQELRERPGALSQMRSITSLVEHVGHIELLWHADYVRAPRSVHDFCVLSHVLAKIGGAGGSAFVIIDGTERLFETLPIDAREMMLQTLEPHHERVLDARRRRTLRDLTEWEWRAVSSAGLLKPARSAALTQEEEPGRHRATRKARHVSRLARARLADDAAKPIAVLRKELSRDGRAPTFAALADEANARGLRTSRGNEWSDVAIARALRRLGDDRE